MSRVAVLAMALALAGLGASQVPAAAEEPDSDVWAPIRPLLGTWHGSEVGNESGSHIERTYELIMGEKFARSTTLAAFDPTEPDAEGDVHQDIGLFSHDPDRDVLLLREFMSEGYVVTYVLARATPESLVWVSESSEGAGGYGARLRYSLLGPDEHMEELDLAPPGKSYFTCHRMKMVRVSE